MTRGSTQPRQPLQAMAGKLKNLVRHAEMLHRVRGKVDTVLADTVGASVRLANVDRGTLVVMARSPAWATRIRYASPEILAQISRLPGMAGVGSIRVCIEQPEHSPPAAYRARPTVSPKSGATIAATAASLPEGDPLRAALLRLAARAR